MESSASWTNRKMRGTTLFVLFCMFFVVTSGVLQPTIMQLIKYQGGAGRTKDENGGYIPPLMVPALSFGVGHALVYFSPTPEGDIRQFTKMTPVDYKRVTFVSFLEMMSIGFFQVGLYLTGSGIYSILYSSCCIWKAILTRVYLKKVLDTWQWFGVLVMMFGLVWNARGNIDAAGEDADDVVFGMGSTLIGAVLHSLAHVLNEGFMKESGHPLSPQKVCAIMGFVMIIPLCLYIVVMTHAYGFAFLVSSQVEAMNGSALTIALLYFVLTIANGVHGASFFYLLGSSVGAVGTGVLKALTTVVVFATSSFFFCNTQKSQCYTMAKGLSTAIVMLGIVLYSYGSQRKPLREKMESLQSGRGSTGSLSGRDMRGPSKSFEIFHGDTYDALFDDVPQTTASFEVPMRASGSDFGQVENR